MPKFLIKPDRDVDFYVEWSTVVDAPTAFGPRAWMLDSLVDDYRPGSERYAHEREVAETRLARTDETGSSAHRPFGCNWDDDGLIYEGRGILPRANIAALCERLAVDEKRDVTDLLTPFEGDTDDQQQ